MKNPIHPSDPEHFRMRNELLQKSLRPDPLPFSIEREFPIVLAPEGRSYSYLSFEGEKLCSHVNLWPRWVVDAQGSEILQIGLVGNVATDERLRGQGHMRDLLATIEGSATREGLAALILWSDLEPFYHRLGYRSLGREFRFHFRKADLHEIRKRRKTLIEADHADGALLASLMALRPPIPLTLRRGVREFQQLLTIPWLSLYVAYEADTPVAYALMGKGYDMVGIVHEWGARKVAHILDLLAFACRDAALASTMLLCPGEIEGSWRDELGRSAVLKEETPMALLKVLPAGEGRSMESLFVWGLDSI